MSFATTITQLGSTEVGSAFLIMGLMFGAALLPLLGSMIFKS